MAPDAYTLSFRELTNENVALVGGKNASLGEMFNKLQSKGISVPNGYATTAEAYWLFLDENGLFAPLSDLLATLDTAEFSNLPEVGARARSLVHGGVMPTAVVAAITDAYHTLSAEYPADIQVAVRSSATAEDLPTASFAGQHDSFLNVRGAPAVVEACQKCFVSLFNDRAIKYRVINKFEHMAVALSAGVQTMVRSDLASAGVAFTIEPETGHDQLIYLTGSWGLGENVVQGAVNPDEYYLFKPSLRNKHHALVTKKLGDKAKTMRYVAEADDAAGGIENTDTPPEQRAVFVLTDAEAEQLGQWCLQIEQHYGMPMDVEWAKDGHTNGLYIVQARPETIHQGGQGLRLHEYHRTQDGPVLATGKAVGSQIVSGVARLIGSPADGHRLLPGEILVTDSTSPDWNAVLKNAAVIVTNKGGRTSHAAIVAASWACRPWSARGDATAYSGRPARHRILRRGRRGPWSTTAALRSGKKPIWTSSQLPRPRTKVMLNLWPTPTAPSAGAAAGRGRGAGAHGVRHQQRHPDPPDGAGRLRPARPTRRPRPRSSELTAATPTSREYFVDKLRAAIGRSPPPSIRAGHRAHERLQDQRICGADRRRGSSSRTRRTR